MFNISVVMRYFYKSAQKIKCVNGIQTFDLISDKGC